MSEHDFDVVISGYGPTGQAAASLLARLGHRVCVFERWPSLYGLPRLCTLDGESARIIQAAGDIDYALRDSNPCRRYLLVNEDQQVLMDIDWTADHVCGYPLRISMHQPDIEDAMDTAARERGAVVMQGWEVVALEQDPDGVAVRARRRAFDEHGEVIGDIHEAEERVVHGKYAIGCDGARSFVRRALGVDCEQLPFRNAWLSVDAIRKRKLPVISGVSDDLRVPVVVCAPEGRTHAAIPVGASRLRFEFLVDPDSDHTERMSYEQGYRALEEVHGLTREDVEIYRHVIYPFEGRLAKKWRVGRVFLAGDAAHLMTPFLGQGACSGLRDSINLAWKLDLVLRGVALDALLDSYEQERIPHARVHVTGSDMLGAMACEADPVAAAGRDQMLLSGQAPPPPPDPVIEHGVLQRGVQAQPPVGDLGPQGIVSYRGRSGRFDDVIGWGFQLIARQHDPGETLDAAGRDFFAEIRGHTVGVGDVEGDGVAADVDGAYERFFAACGIEGVLLRPDFTVFGVLHSLADAATLVADLRVQLGATQTSLV
jgi:3-(3-hydroxy-phenyl)propionate hydroxylase